MSPDERSQSDRDDATERAHKVVIAVLKNKPFMDGVYQGLEDERLGKGVSLKDLKRSDGGR